MLASKDMAEGDRNQVQKDLEHKENELKNAQEQQARLEKKLQDLQSKVSNTVLCSEFVHMHCISTYMYTMFK